MVLCGVFDRNLMVSCMLFMKNMSPASSVIVPVKTENMSFPNVKVLPPFLVNNIFDFTHEVQFHFSLDDLPIEQKSFRYVYPRKRCQLQTE